VLGRLYSEWKDGEEAQEAAVRFLNKVDPDSDYRLEKKKKRGDG
jgi:hypothetical protein